MTAFFTSIGEVITGLISQMSTITVALMNNTLFIISISITIFILLILLLKKLYLNNIKSSSKITSYHSPEEIQEINDSLEYGEVGLDFDFDEYYENKNFQHDLFIAEKELSFENDLLNNSNNDNNIFDDLLSGNQDISDSDLMF